MVVDRVSRTLGIEKKFLDTENPTEVIPISWAALNPDGTGTAGSNGCISMPSQGDGNQQREGRMYTIDSIFVRGFVSTGTVEQRASPPPDFRVRIIVYWDKQTNETELVPTLLMDTIGLHDEMAFRNLNHSHRFEVLMDRTLLFKTSSSDVNEGAINGFAVGTMEMRFSCYKKFPKGIQVQCSGNIANVDSCTDNSFGVCAITSNTTMTPVIHYKARMRFRG